MVLIIESGSSKSDWVFVANDNSVTHTFQTMGFNPLFHSTDFIIEEIKRSNVLSAGTVGISDIYFYGAGCSSPENNLVVRNALTSVYPGANIFVDHDLSASVYATYSGVPGISCILGTGSNCVYFDGKIMQQFTPSLGYILGDEASGSYFGKQLLRTFLYKQLPAKISGLLEQEYSLDKEDVIRRIYKQPHANVFLAGFSTFIYKVKDDPFISKMLYDGMKLFLETHVCAVPGYRDMPVHFTGSVAFFFMDSLKEAASDLKINIGQVIRSPMENLINYHGRHQNV